MLKDCQNSKVSSTEWFEFMNIHSYAPRFSLSLSQNAYKISIFRLQEEENASKNIDGYQYFRT